MGKGGWEEGEDEDFLSVKITHLAPGEYDIRVLGWDCDSEYEGALDYNNPLATGTIVVTGNTGGASAVNPIGLTEWGAYRGYWETNFLEFWMEW